MEVDGFILVSRPGEECSSAAALHHQDDGSLEYLSEIDTFVDSLKEPLWPLNCFIHQNPELAFQEYKAHQALTDFLRLREEGWTVTPSAYGMETAWVAAYDSGVAGPVVSFNVEMDALPNIGHACGHNLIAMASLSAGLATASLMRRHSLPGKVLIFGTPGEEGYRGGKTVLLARGAYAGVDISLISHPGTQNNNPMVRTTAFCRLAATYTGVPAHAAKAPWRGVNALDALVLAYNAVSALRQQTMPGDVISLAITNGGGDAASVVHAHAAGVCVLRARSAARLEVLQRKVAACFRAGAEATGARVQVEVTKGYRDHVPNRVLAECYARCWRGLREEAPDPPIPRCGEAAWLMAGTDQGDVSYALPSVNASFAIVPGPLGGEPHSPDFEGAAGTRGAFGRALRVGRALAGTAVEVLTAKGLLDEVKREWRRSMDGVEDREEVILAN